MKKWTLTAIASIVIMPIIAFSWSNLRSIWAAPEKVENISKQVDSHESHLEKISSLYLEQKARQDTQERLNELREQNLKEQLMLIVELKKKK